MVIGGAIDECRTLAERLKAPVCSGYQHNDSFPGSHPLAAGPLGYNDSKAAMELIAQADMVLALGTRLNPFSTLPGCSRSSSFSAERPAPARSTRPVARSHPQAHEIGLARWGARS